MRRTKHGRIASVVGWVLASGAITVLVAAIYAVVSR